MVLIGYHLSDNVHTLNSQKDKYKELVVIIQAHDSLISFKELYDKLINHEMYMRRDKMRPTITTQFN